MPPSEADTYVAALAEMGWRVVGAEGTDTIVCYTPIWASRGLIVKKVR